MAIDLGSMFSSIEVRTSGIDRGAKQASSLLNKMAADISNISETLNKKLEAQMAASAERAAKAGEAAAKRAGEAIKRQAVESARALESIGRSLTYSIAAPIGLIGAAAFKASMEMDTLKKSLLAVTGSQKEMNRQLERSKELARLPGLGQVEIISGLVKLQAGGMNFAIAERSLAAMGNSLATLGKGKVELAAVVEQMSQMSGKGRILTEDLRIIASYVPQLRGAMAEAFGVSDVEKIGKMGITVSDFWNRVDSVLEKQPKMVNGVKNAMENFGDASRRALASIGDSILPVAAKLLDMLTPAIEKVGERFRALPDSVKQFTLGTFGIAAMGSVAILWLGKIKVAVLELQASFIALGTRLAGLQGALARLAAAANPVTLTAALLFGSESPAGRGGDLNLEQRFPDPKVRLEYLKRSQEAAQKQLLDNQKALKEMGPGKTGPTRRTGLPGLDETLDDMFGPDDPSGPNRDRFKEMIKAISDGIKGRQKLIDDLTLQLSPKNAGIAPMGIKPRTQGGRYAALLLALDANQKEESELKGKLAAAKPADLDTLGTQLRAVQDRGKDIQKSLDAFEPDPAAEEKAKKAAERKYEAAQRTAQRILKLRRETQKLMEDAINAGSKAGDKAYREYSTANKAAAMVDTSALSLVGPELGRIIDEDAAKRSQQAINEFIDRQFILVDRRRALMKEQDDLIKEARQKNADKIGAGLLDSLGNTASGISSSVQSAVRSAQDRATRSQELDTFKKRFRDSIAGNFALDLGYELGNSLFRGLQKSFGNNPFGNALARSLTRIFDQAIDSAVDGLAGSLFGGKKGGTKGLGSGIMEGDDISKFLPGGGNIFGSILNMGLSSLTGGLFSGLFGSLFGGLFGKGKGGGIGGALGSIAGDLGSVFGFAEGGFPPVGRWSLVGEEGPELIRPMSPMQVVPNGGFAMDGGGSIHISGPLHFHGIQDVAGLMTAIQREANRQRPMKGY